MMRIGTISITLFWILNGCIEAIAPENLRFEDLLVVDARISDQFRQQVIRLSRTSPLGSDPLRAETGADVFIETSNGDIIDFREEEDGLYVSEIPFAAQSQLAYQLSINLSNGISYQSQEESLLQTPPIESVYGDFQPFSASNLEGSGTFSFFFDSEAEENTTRFYLIEWSETFALKVPFPSTFIWRGGSIIEERGPFDQVELCYQTEGNDQVIVQESLLASGRIVRFPLRTFASITQKLAIRYSLEVTYYALGRDAFSYWEQLQRSQNNATFFQQEQPGSIIGNVVSSNGDLALGRFDVLSEQRMRVFFDPADFFEDGYRIVSDNIIACQSPEEFRTEVGEVEDFLENNSNLDVWFVESGLNDSDMTNFTPMVVYLAKQCTNCTFFGTNERPDFWIE